MSHQHLSHIRTAPRAALLKGNLVRERGEEGGECVGGGGTEEQVVVVVMKECRREGGKDGVFLSEASLNTEHLPHSRLELEAEEGGGGQICVHSCV